jgi:phage gp45-like
MYGSMLNFIMIQYTVWSLGPAVFHRAGLGLVIKQTGESVCLQNRKLKCHLLQEASLSGQARCCAAALPPQCSLSLAVGGEVESRHSTTLSGV